MAIDKAVSAEEVIRILAINSGIRAEYWIACFIVLTDGKS